MGATLSFLGTGSALTCAERNNTSLYFDLWGDGILVDCPGSAGHKIQKLGYKPSDVKAIILTHEHLDHVSGLPSLLHELWLAKIPKGVPLKLFANNATMRVVRYLLNPRYFHFCKELDFELIEIPTNSTASHALIETETYKIYTAPVCHEVPAIGVRVSIRGEKDTTVVYTGDTTLCDQLVVFSRDADYLIAEAGAGTSAKSLPGHMNGKDAGKLAKLAGARTLILVHVPGGEDENVLKDMAKAHFRGVILIPNDLDTIELVA